ncbi:MAG TPA: hemolysin III family protein [Roseiarcus sp.]|jgi:hemolysin III
MSAPPPDLERPYSNGELLADGFIHVAALIAGLIGFSLFFSKTPLHGGFSERIAMIVYAAAFFVLFSFSFAYNMAPVSRMRMKRFLGRCDRSAIYLMIAGTYTALLSQVHGSFWIAGLVGFVWTGAIGGAALNIFAPKSIERIAVALYLALGWSAIVVIKPLVADLPANTLALVVAGGLLYSGGVPFYLWRNLKFQNAIWHGFVTIAAACHFAGIFTAVTQIG